MSWLLHRDTCAAAVRNVRRVNARVVQHSGQLHVSAVTITVLELWLLRGHTPVRYHQAYRALWQQLKVLSVDDQVARRPSSIGGRLPAQGPKLTLVDLFVAATALVHDLTLVTHDTTHFAYVPGLRVVDWLVP